MTCFTFLAALISTSALLSACAPATVRHSVSPYRPEVPAQARTPWVWRAKTENPGDPSAGDLAAKSAGERDAVAGAVPPQSAPVTTHDNHDGLRRLHPGDAISISIMSSTDAISYKEEIDNEGMVKVKFLGNVYVNDKTTSEAEQLIEKLYIEREIYRNNIDVVVMAQQVTYFIRGEVKSPGQYPLTAGKTLLQAIAEAGGYTDFYDDKGEIKRGDRTISFNTKKNKTGDQKNPTIQDGDIIVIFRSIFGI